MMCYCWRGANENVTKYDEVNFEHLACILIKKQEIFPEVTDSKITAKILQMQQWNIEKVGCNIFLWLDLILQIVFVSCV